jgi:hypothetical protein
MFVMHQSILLYPVPEREFGSAILCGVSGVDKIEQQKGRVI